MYTINNLGDRLRQERERQGLTIEDVAQRTYIRRRYLEAIETGDHSIMPGEVYVKGFLRSYAEALGLNGWDFVAEYNKLYTEKSSDEGASDPAVPDTQSEVGIQEKQAAKTRVIQNPIMLPAKQKYMQNKSKQDRRLLGLVTLVVLMLALYLVFVPNGVEAPGTGQIITEPVVAPTAAEPVVTPVEPVEPVESEKTNLSNELDKILEPEPTSTDPTIILPVNVVVRAIEDCWVEIYVDGDMEYTGVITAGLERVVYGQQRVQVRFGNPEGVVVLHNGEAVEGMGKNVQTRVFTPETHYTIQDLRREERPTIENTVEPVANQLESAGISEPVEN